ncbi:MAG TPA: hypothetical protein VKT33_01240 [Candidatus Angelobacter sp.]|nr:hypothetical protein [Candidatus Angelobacter sp.]
MQLLLTQISGATWNMSSDPHMLMAAVFGVLTSFATVVQNLSAIFEFQSLESRTKQEKDRIREDSELLATLQEQTTEEAMAARKQLQEDIRLALGRLVRLTEASRTARLDPNHDLSFFQRLFILFAPRGRRAVVVHVLAYAFMITVTMLFLGDAYFDSRLHTETYADMIVFSGYCALAFRSWALSERRWRLGYDPTNGLRRSVFILRAPVNHAMLLAQICFWASNFWIAEGVEDIVLDAANGIHLPVLGSVLKVAAPLVAAVICRKWALAEVKESARIPWMGMKLPVWNSRTRPLWLLALVCLTELGVSIADLFAKQSVFLEAFHQWAFVFESVTACVASLAWLSLTSRSLIDAVPEEASRSAAA